MRNIRHLFILIALFVLSGKTMATLPEPIPMAYPESHDVLDKIERVNDYWQAHNSPYVRGFWDNAAYFTGNMEAYKLTGKAQYYDFSDKWCRHNQWKGAKQTDKSKWKYANYGEGDDYVLFGDWQICFQTYIDMYNLIPADYKVARAKEVMSYECNHPDNKFWWWADALYMVMPVMTKMYLLTGEQMYLDKLYENYLWSDSLMWDAEAQLYYRDGKYIWPKVKTSCDGGKSFWARGDGWVLAGLAKVLADMPVDYKHRDFFVTRFQQLAQGVARCQQEGGYWSRSMLCEADAPGPETSGTAFFCYGLEWGVNHGLLSKVEYGPTIEKAWNYLSKTALQADGSIGYVQPIGEKPDPTKIVDAHSQAPFGTGAWLLAACERVRYLDGSAKTSSVKRGQPGLAASGSTAFWVKNPSDRERQDVVELDARSVFRKLNIGGGRQFVVLDGDDVEIPYQLTSDGKLLVQVFLAPNAYVPFRICKGEPKQYRLDCNGRIYPNREDDLVWENDKCAWRFYGPKMKGKGVNGFDTFAKNVTYPIQDQLYQNELTSYGVNEQLKKQGRGGEWAQIHRDIYTYHRDRGQGMDDYTVGATLGAGAPALMEGNTLVMPDAYAKAEILDNGPLRFTVRQTMNITQPEAPQGGENSKGREGDSYREVRLISQDKGSHFARFEVTYQGLQKAQSVCAGIVVHESQPNAYVINKKSSYVAYSDALATAKGQNGQLYIGLVFPEKMKSLRYLAMPEKKSGAVGHVIGETTYQPEGTFTYYSGSAWSKYDCPSMTIWQALLQDFTDNLKQPLKVEM